MVARHPAAHMLHVTHPPPLPLFSSFFQVFLGASVLGSIMAARDEFWMTRKEYEEMGIDALVAKKCSY